MIGARLSALRKEQNMTQKELADKLSLSINSVSLYERDLSSPSDETKLQMASLFGVSVDYLLGNTEHKRPLSGAGLLLIRSLPQEANEELFRFLHYLKIKYDVQGEML